MATARRRSASAAMHLPEFRNRIVRRQRLRRRRVVRAGRRPQIQCRSVASWLRSGRAPHRRSFRHCDILTANSIARHDFRTVPPTVTLGNALFAILVSCSSNQLELHLHHPHATSYQSAVPRRGHLCRRFPRLTARRRLSPTATEESGHTVDNSHYP